MDVLFFKKLGKKPEVVSKLKPYIFTNLSLKNFSLPLNQDPKIWLELKTAISWTAGLKISSIGHVRWPVDNESLVVKPDLPERFRAVISINRKSVHIGMFDTAEQAALAYNVASRELYGLDGKQNVLHTNKPIAEPEVDMEKLWKLLKKKG